jgi:hypothetical protein
MRYILWLYRWLFGGDTLNLTSEEGKKIELMWVIRPLSWDKKSFQALLESIEINLDGNKFNDLMDNIDKEQNNE